MGIVVCESRRQVKSTSLSMDTRDENTRTNTDWNSFSGIQEYPRASAQSRGEEFAPYCPVPVSFITAGLSGALLLTVTAPLIDPFAFGVKVTLNVQVAPEATVAPQGVPPEGAAE
jgi:hypothetical protein